MNVVDLLLECADDDDAKEQVADLLKYCSRSVCARVCVSGAVGNLTHLGFFQAYEKKEIFKITKLLATCLIGRTRRRNACALRIVSALFKIYYK